MNTTIKRIKHWWKYNSLRNEYIFYICPAGLNKLYVNFCGTNKDNIFSYIDDCIKDDQQLRKIENVNFCEIILDLYNKFNKYYYIWNNKRKTLDNYIFYDYKTNNKYGFYKDKKQVRTHINTKFFNKMFIENFNGLMFWDDEYNPHYVFECKYNKKDNSFYIKIASKKFTSDWLKYFYENCPVNKIEEFYDIARINNFEDILNNKKYKKEYEKYIQRYKNNYDKYYSDWSDCKYHELEELIERQ